MSRISGFLEALILSGADFHDSDGRGFKTSKGKAIAFPLEVLAVFWAFKKPKNDQSARKIRSNGQNLTILALQWGEKGAF